MSHVNRHTRAFAINRRRAVQLGAVGAGLSGLQARSASAQADATPAATPVAAADIPVSGEDVPELSAFDDLITSVMSKWSLPGGEVAIARDNRLVYNRGFGYASVEDEEVVEPEMTFRIASTSKPFTSVAVQQLIDNGDIALDTPVFPLLALEGPANAPRDPRLDTITIEQLMVHSGGWNSCRDD